MPTVNFESPPWTSATGIDICAMGGAGNGLYDHPNGINCIIADGKMSVQRSASTGNHTLFFTKVQCSGTVGPVTTLVIRFDQPWQRIKLHLSFDPNGVAPVNVKFYESYNRGTLLRDTNIPPGPVGVADVVYDSQCFPAMEIVIRTDRAENNVDNVEYGPTQQRLLLGAFWCIVQRYLNIPVVDRPTRG